MRKISLILIILIFINLFVQKPVYAEGNLIVDYGGVGPLFDVSNMKPGDVKIKEVLVSNESNEIKQIGFKGVKTKDSKDLAQVIEIKVSKGGVDLYGGSKGIRTLKNLFDESQNQEIFLDQISSGFNQKYTLSLSLVDNISNKFENSELIFDLTLGSILQMPESCRGMIFSGKPIIGTEGADILFGTNKSEMIIGLEGNDIILGGGGDDCVVGGLGRDIILGGGGNDRIDGGADFDICQGRIKFACEL